MLSFLLDPTFPQVIYLPTTFLFLHLYISALLSPVSVTSKTALYASALPSSTFLLSSFNFPLASSLPLSSFFSPYHHHHHPSMAPLSHLIPTHFHLPLSLHSITSLSPELLCPSNHAKVIYFFFRPCFFRSPLPCSCPSRCPAAHWDVLFRFLYVNDAHILVTLWTELPRFKLSFAHPFSYSSRSLLSCITYVWASLIYTQT